MGKIIIDNFFKMTGGYLPAVSRDLMHRLIIGFIPAYFKLVSLSQDANIYKKVTPPYSLVLGPAPTSINSYASAYPTTMIPNTTDSLGKLILSTNLWRFYAEDSSQTDLGIPNGTPTTNVGIDAVIYAGKILTTHPLDSNAYHGAVNATPAWTATTGTGLTTGTAHPLATFGSNAYTADASAGATVDRRLVRIINSSFAISAGLDLGGTFSVRDMVNYNDRHLAVFAESAPSPRTFERTYCFLWNGNASNNYEYAIKLRGAYRCSIVKDGVMYIFCQQNNWIVAYRLGSYAVQEVARIKDLTISTVMVASFKNRVSIEENFFAILTTTGMLHWDLETGESFIAQKNVSGAPVHSICVLQDSDSGAPYRRYEAAVNGSGVGFLWDLNFASSTKTDIGAEYNGNLIQIPVDPVIHGDTADFGRAKIDRIDVEFSTPPPTSSDIISLTLTYNDEYANETYETYVSTIKNSTANSTNAVVDAKRAIVNNIGGICTKFKIDMSLTTVTTSWDLSIKRVIVYYTPVKIQS